MYIEPNTIIKFYKNIPIDNTYNHCLFFNSIAKQNEYFHANVSNLITTVDRNMYQRVNKGSMRVAIKAEVLYNCNYIAFRNTNFGEKWFYAFVKSVDYVNNETSVLEYEIDVIQTYIFNINFKQCFIERKHTATDNVGDNIVPENVDIGYYVKNTAYTYPSGTEDALKGYSLVIACGYIPPTPTNPSGVAPLMTYGGVISGIAYYIFKDLVKADGRLDTTLRNNVDSTINDIVSAGQTDSIVNIFLFPTQLLKTSEEGGTYTNANPGSYTLNIGDLSRNNISNRSLSGYTPRNKKCYTFPYTTVYVGDWNGETSMLLKPEQINSNSAIKASGAFCSTPSAVVYPTNYNNQSEDIFDGYTVTRFPQVAYTTDSYRAFIAQGGLAQDVLGVFGSLFGGLSNVGTSAVNNVNPYNPSLLGMGNVASSAIDSSIGLASSLATLCYHTNMPRATHGKSSSDALTAMHKSFVHIEHRHINLDMLKRIDNYFTVYGYAVNEIGLPNHITREEWTYTKTKGCKVVGECPSDDIKMIESIFDKGVTFWRNPSNVGRYDLPNNPLT